MVHRDDEIFDGHPPIGAPIESRATLDRQSAEMNARFDGLQRQMASQTRWTVGTLALFCSLGIFKFPISRTSHPKQSLAAE